MNKIGGTKPGMLCMKVHVEIARCAPRPASGRVLLLLHNRADQGTTHFAICTCIYADVATVYISPARPSPISPRMKHVGPMSMCVKDVSSVPASPHWGHPACGSYVTARFTHSSWPLQIF
jgi:hypothetical protein